MMDDEQTDVIATTRCSRSRSRRTWRGCTRRRCGSTTGSASCRPRRTAGKSRRYSLREVAQLREVQRLSGEGVSLEGIRRILELENEVVGLRGRVRELESALATSCSTGPAPGCSPRPPTGDVVPLRHGTRTVRRNEVVVWRPRASE